MPALGGRSTRWGELLPPLAAPLRKNAKRHPTPQYAEANTPQRPLGGEQRGPTSRRPYCCYFPFVRHTTFNAPKLHVHIHRDIERRVFAAVVLGIGCGAAVVVTVVMLGFAICYGTSGMTHNHGIHRMNNFVQPLNNSITHCKELT